MGPSGSGKSTLLHCAAGLDKPTKGQVWIAGKEITDIHEPELTHIRRRDIGFVFQSFNLVDSISVWDNILLPQRLAGVKTDKTWAKEILERVGLSGHRNAYPSELSGGQQQRVALARALASRPKVIFADEPTGALDISAGHETLRLLRSAVDQGYTAVIMVTHDPAAASWADRVVFLADGHLVNEMQHPTAQKIADFMTSLNGR